MRNFPFPLYNLHGMILTKPDFLTSKTGVLNSLSILLQEKLFFLRVLLNVFFKVVLGHSIRIKRIKSVYQFFHRLKFRSVHFVRHIGLLLGLQIFSINQNMIFLIHIGLYKSNHRLELKTIFIFEIFRIGPF